MWDAIALFSNSCGGCGKAVFTGTWEGGGRCGSDTLGTRLSGVFETFPLRVKVK